MEFELRHVKLYPRLSDDSNAFTATLYVDGKKVAHCKDDGNGGEISIQPFDDMRNLFAEAVFYAAELPARQLEGYGDIPSDLTLVVSDLLEAHIVEKEEAKNRKLMLTAIVIGKAGSKVGTSYFKLQKGQTVAALLENPEIVVKWLAKHILPKLAADEVIINTNIPADLIEKAKQVN